jgi:hypothetical protein
VGGGIDVAEREAAVVVLKALIAISPPSALNRVNSAM